MRCINTGVNCWRPRVLRRPTRTFVLAKYRLQWDGDVLVITLVERPSISEINIDGNKAIKTEDLLDITLSDKAGRTTTLSVSADVAHGILNAVRDFAKAEPSKPSLVKRPTQFAVGTGRHESAVLMRFDDDVPYGLDADTAIEFAHAILDAAQAVEARPARRLQ